MREMRKIVYWLLEFRFFLIYFILFHYFFFLRMESCNEGKAYQTYYIDIFYIFNQLLLFILSFLLIVSIHIYNNLLFIFYFYSLRSICYIFLKITFKNY